LYSQRSLWDREEGLHVSRELGAALGAQVEHMPPGIDAEEELSMSDLAQQLGISLRSLQLAFAKVHDGKSPRQISNQIRLLRARQRLLEASENA
jgi:transcriptional regulator GlxA family with amidase domain